MSVWLEKPARSLWRARSNKIWEQAWHNRQIFAYANLSQKEMAKLQTSTCLITMKTQRSWQRLCQDMGKSAMLPNSPFLVIRCHGFVAGITKKSQHNGIWALLVSTENVRSANPDVSEARLFQWQIQLYTSVALLIKLKITVREYCKLPKCILEQIPGCKFWGIFSGYFDAVFTS